MTLHTLQTLLRPVPPFEFDLSLKFLAQFPITAGEQRLEPHILTKAFMIAEQPVLCRLESRGKVESPLLRCTLWAANPIDQAAAEDRLRFYLSLDDQLQPFYDLAWDDPPFAGLVNQLYGYHQVKFPTPFENACWAILSQRMPMFLARKTKSKLISQFGGSVTLKGQEYWAFPTPAGILAADPSQLSAAIGNARKTGYILAAAQAFAHADELWLRHGPLNEVRDWLLAIKGIGVWSAGFILIRGLGQMAQFDIGKGKQTITTLAAINDIYGPLRPEQAQQIVNRYAAWQGYWIHYLRFGT